MVLWCTAYLFSWLLPLSSIKWPELSVSGSFERLRHGELVVRPGYPGFLLPFYSSASCKLTSLCVALILASNHIFLIKVYAYIMHVKSDNKTFQNAFATQLNNWSVGPVMFCHNFPKISSNVSDHYITCLVLSCELSVSSHRY